jgi:predicted RNA-binding protein YlxR (DUF448 family)
MQAVSQDSELDLGATGVAPEMEYICAVTREAKPAAEMIRFAVDNGQVVPDVRRKWAIGDAVRRNVFARGFKRDIGIAPDLTAQTEQMIELAALDALAIAGNAGKAINGYSRVKTTVSRDDIHAANAADEDKSMLAGALRRDRTTESLGIVVIDAFIGAQLDLALNGLNVVHAALLSGPGSETFLTRVLYLTRFRTGSSPDAVNAHAPTGGV